MNRLALLSIACILLCATADAYPRWTNRRQSYTPCFRKRPAKSNWCIPTPSRSLRGRNIPDHSHSATFHSKQDSSSPQSVRRVAPLHSAVPPVMIHEFTHPIWPLDETVYYRDGTAHSVSLPDSVPDLHHHDRHVLENDGVGRTQPWESPEEQPIEWILPQRSPWIPVAIPPVRE